MNDCFSTYHSFNLQLQQVEAVVVVIKFHEDILKQCYQPQYLFIYTLTIHFSVYSFALHTLYYLLKLTSSLILEASNIPTYILAANIS